MLPVTRPDAQSRGLCQSAGLGNHHPVRHLMPGKPTPRIQLDRPKLLGFDQVAALAAKVGNKPSSAPLVTLPDPCGPILTVGDD